MCINKEAFSANRRELARCRVTCPECGQQSHVFDFHPGRCPGCGADLGYYTPDDLQLKPLEPVMVAVDVLTGQAVVLEETA